MKKLLMLIPVLLLLLNGCEYIDMVAAPSPTLISLPVSTAVRTPAPSVAASPSGLPLPALPSGIHSQSRYFEDGFEIVSLVQCFDGDTASFIVSSEVRKVRFLAIDTPEINSPYVDKEAWSDEALAFTESMLRSASEIILEADPGSDVTDEYGRLLCWIWADGTLVNAALVQHGLAEVKYLFGDYRYTDTLLLLEQQAQRQRLGIWQSAITTD